MIFRKLKKIVNNFIREIRFNAATKCEYLEEIKNAKCCHCGKRHDWDVYEDSMYRGKTLCQTCYEEYYGFCNVCGDLYLYDDMNENNICGGCQALQQNLFGLTPEKQRSFLKFCEEAGLLEGSEE